MDSIRIVGASRCTAKSPSAAPRTPPCRSWRPALLTEERLVLTRVPRLADIETMGQLLAQHGIAVERTGNDGRSLSLGGPITNTEAPYDIVRKCAPPSWCWVRCWHGWARRGSRCPAAAPSARAPSTSTSRGWSRWAPSSRSTPATWWPASAGRLRGATIIFPMVSVGATENLLMAASLAEGQTVLRNAAREPEIIDLCHCLVAMGARIGGIGTGEIVVEGVDRLHAATHAIIPDRIETGTYACAVAIAGGEVVLRDARIDHLGAVSRVLEEAGILVSEVPEGVSVRRLNGLHGADVMTEPYPASRRTCRRSSWR